MTRGTERSESRSLPDMLRDDNPTVERRNEGWAARREDKWLQVGIGPELAALVEAADAVVRGCPPDAEYEVHSYNEARAALVAALGGDK